MDVSQNNILKSQLACISPVDGRYYNKTKELRPYFSEHSFFKYRLMVEISYLYELLHMLMDKNILERECISSIKNIVNEFTLEECVKIKEIEYKINHDVKSIEYYLKDKVRFAKWKVGNVPDWWQPKSN